MDPGIPDIHRDKKALKLSDRLIRHEKQLGLIGIFVDFRVSISLNPDL